jgi:peptidoglycan hydrolase-like protein with peptidoglycan-binding domain
MSDRNPRAKLIGAGVVGAVVAGLLSAGLVLGPASGQETDSSTTDPETSETQARDYETVPVERGALTETKDAVGAIGHGDSWTAAIEPQGVVTKRHDKGTVVEHGEPLIWVGNKPVYLAEGDTPMYRNLTLQRDADKKYMNGDDVRQLQEFLIDQGFDDKERLEADGVFGIGTKRAVKAWQKENGLEQSGSVDRSQLLFTPTALRIESEARIGSNFMDLTVTSADQQITASFDPKNRGFVEEGATVELDLGSEQKGEGTISEITSTVGDDGSRRINVTIKPKTPIPSDVERVSVVVTRELASDVLLIPVRAILALAGGGYAVEVDGPSGPTLTRVELGALVDDVAEVSGDFNEGDMVVIPVDILGETS